MIDTMTNGRLHAATVLRAGALASALLLVTAVPALGQASESGTGTAESDSIPPRTGSGVIVSGNDLDRLPLDEARGIVVLQPGVATTNLGRSIRGGQPNDEAVMIDGVLSRSFGTGTSGTIALPTNAVEQVDVTIGTFSAEFGEARSGLVSYTTRSGAGAPGSASRGAPGSAPGSASGGRTLSGWFEAMSDQLGPDAWRTNFNRAEITLGGPIAGPVTFFLAGTASGQDARVTEFAPPRFVIDGLDTCDIENFCEVANGGPGLGAPAVFRMARPSIAEGHTDSLDVAAPRFVEWGNGRTLPNGWRQDDLFHGNVGWELPRGSRLHLSLNRNRSQQMGHPDLGASYRFDGVDGALTSRTSYALSWLQTLKRTADEWIAFDLLAAYSRDRTTSGMLDQRWWREHRDPAFGFVFGDLDFAFDDAGLAVTGFDPFDPSEAFINAYRSNAIPRDSLLLVPGRGDLVGTSQTLRGLSSNLRANPYGLRTAFPLSGAGNEGLARRSEDRIQLRGAADWQLGRFQRLRAGAEYFGIGLDAFNRPLAAGLPLPETANPRKLGLFVQDRLQFGALVLDAGLRYDRLDTDAEFPLVPGFVFNVPDSLRAGFVRFDTGTGSYVPLDEPCNGAPVCRSNFFEAEAKSKLSPRVGLSYAVSPRSAVRASFGRFVQTPAFFTTDFPVVGDAGVESGPGLLQNANFDRQNGNGREVFARDVDLPSSRLLELGYRALLGDDLVVDLAVFGRSRRGALTVRAEAFEDPNTQSMVFVNVVANGPDTENHGFEVRLDKAVGQLFDTRLSYSFVDADAALLNAPARHNVALTSSLAFPADYRAGSIVGTILRDVGLYAVLRVRSGLPYNRLENLGSGQIGPPDAVGALALPRGDTTTPGATSFDLRLAKSFEIGSGLDLQAFIDWRNPFDIENQSTVFLETGAATNPLFRAIQIDSFLRDTSLDGSNDVDDFDIRAESPENPFNQFMLLRTEQRFGNGDGVFTVEEQEAAFSQVYETEFGVSSRFEASDQLMRLGVRLAF